MIRKSALLVALVLFAFSLPAMACDGDKSGIKTASVNADNATCDGMKATKASGTDGIVRQANFEGKLVCMGCDLKKAGGAGAACSAYGHKHAVKTADGRYINFLENKQSEDLISGEKYHNKHVKVQGVFYANANQLEVKTFEVDGKSINWCDHCKGMDACMLSKADNQ